MARGKQIASYLRGPLAAAYERMLLETGVSSYQYILDAVKEKMLREGHYKEPGKLKLAVDNRGRSLAAKEEPVRPVRRRRRVRERNGQ